MGKGGDKTAEERPQVLLPCKGKFPALARLCGHFSRAAQVQAVDQANDFGKEYTEQSDFTWKCDEEVGSWTFFQHCLTLLI
eukprot:COSAG01_NODE_41_length_32446_cov_41.218877_10_plen_81_part_00